MATDLGFVPDAPTADALGFVPDGGDVGFTPDLSHKVNPNLVSTTEGGTHGGGLRLDPFTRNDLPDAADVQEVMADVSRPAIPLPKFTINPDDSKLKAVGKSIANLGISLPEFVESPLGIASGGAATVIPRLVAAGFLADTGKSVVEQSGQLGTQWDAMTPGQRAAAVTDLGGSTLLAAAMAHGATRLPVKDAINIETQAKANPTPSNELGFVPDQQPTANPIAEAGDQLQTESKGTAATAEVPMAPAIGEKQPPAPPANVESPTSNVESKLPTIAEKAAANPTAQPTMQDLADMVREIKGANPFATKQPTEAHTTPVAEPEPLSPVQPAKVAPEGIPEAGTAISEPADDFARYQQLTASLKGKGMDEAQPIMQELEAIKNRNGGNPPSPSTENPSVPVPPVTASTATRAGQSYDAAFSASRHAWDVDTTKAHQNAIKFHEAAKAANPSEVEPHNQMIVAHQRAIKNIAQGLPGKEPATGELRGSAATTAALPGQSVEPTPPALKAKEVGVPSLEKVRTGSVDTPAQGSLNQALKLKADTWKRVQSIRQQIKARPLNTGNLRVDLIKAESAHREALQMERDARAGIETRANEQGQTTKPTPTVPAEKPSAKVETPAAAVSKVADHIQEVKQTEGMRPESTSTISDKANRIADKIEEIFRSEGKGKLRTLPVDRIIEAGAKIAADIIRAGGKLADAIAAGVKHIRDNYKGDFDEKAFADKIRAAQAEESPLPEGASPANKFSAIVRDALGLPERDTPERQSRESVVADAEARMARHPALAADLVDQVTKNPRELKPWEQVVFLRHVVDLKKSLEAAREEVFQAKKDGNLADEEIAVLHANELSDRVHAAVDAFEKSGTPSARSLQFRNTLMKEDYSTESLEMGARAARGGERLSESELAKIKEQSDEIHATQQKIDEETKAQAERDAEDASIHAHEEMIRQAEKEPWHAFSPEVMERAKKLVAAFDRKADESRAELRKMGFRFNSAMGAIDPTPLYHLARIGAAHAARFALKSVEWANAMVAELGEGVRKHLPQIAAAAEKVLKQEGGDKIPRPRTKSGKPVDTVATIKATLKKIHEEIADGATPKDYANLIRSIARRAVEGGMRDRNEIVDSVHRQLKEKGVEITRNEVRDAISGYGDYRQLSKAEVDVELGRVKDELRKVAQIEALEKGQAPLKSGVEHRASQDEARRMQQRINQLKKELGIVSGDPKTQLKSALASKKTRLNNQIRDLEHEIATREKIVREHGQTPTDPETDALTAKRDALKKERDTIFKGEMSDEQRLALSERAAQRSLDEWNQKLADAQKGKFDLGDSKRDMPASDKLKAVRDALDAAKAEVEHLKSLAHPELAEQAALAAKKASLLKSIATYSDKLARGDFSTRPKAKTNPKLAALEAQKKRVFETYRAANKKATLARRPFWVKAVEAVPKFIGQAVLSSPATLVKLAAASATHVILRPIDDITGGALGRLPGLRGVAGQARTEGAGFGLSDYAKSLAKAATQGVVDARKTLNLKATLKPIASYAKGVLTGDKAAREAAKTEFRNVPHTSDLDERFGKAGHGRDSLEFFGLLHGAEKAPLKRFVFEYNYARGVDWAERNGLDPKDPIVAMRIGLDAFKQAQRALFLEDNRATDAFNAGLGTLARPYKVDVGGKMVEKHPAIGTVGTAAIRANMPVIKVAANVMAQAFERAGGGLVMGAGRIARYGGTEAAKRGTGMSLRERFAKGLAEMPEGEADKVIGNLKRGLVGSAFMLFAFYNYQSFGGFWQQGEKRKSGEIKADEIRLGEHDVPPLLLHNPLFIAGQAAATARKVAESKLRKNDKEAQGYDDGLLAAALGIAQTTPFTREAETVSQILNPHTRQGALGRAAQMAIPQAIQAPARWMDKDASGNVIRRDPKSIWQSLETGIPGLRKNVPEKKK